MGRSLDILSDLVFDRFPLFCFNLRALLPDLVDDGAHQLVVFRERHLQCWPFLAFRDRVPVRATCRGIEVDFL